MTLEEVPARELIRDYECSNDIPRHSVAEAVADLLSWLDLSDRAMLSDPRHYNIRWLELLHEVHPEFQRLGAVL